MILRRAFLCLLAGSFVFSQPTYARWKTLTPDPEQLLPLSQPEAYTQPPEELSLEDQALAKEFLQEPTEYILEVMYLLKKLYSKADKAIKTSSIDDVARRLIEKKDSTAIAWEENGVGKAELVALGKGENTRFITKVRHNGAKATFLFVDRNQIDLENLEKQPDSALPKEQFKEELQLRRYLSVQWKTLLARMILSEWNPSFVYTGLQEAQKNLENQVQNEESMIHRQKEEEALRQLRELQELSGGELKKKEWYHKFHEKWFDLAMSAQPLKEETESTKETIVIFYDGTNGKILNKKVHKPHGFMERSWVSKAKYSEFLQYVVNYWRAVWEPPAYSQSAWKNEKGLGKLRVLISGDYLMAMGMGFTLSSLSYGMAMLVPSSLPSGLDAMSVAQISLGWSLFFGVFSRTWQNFVYRGSDFARFCKNWITGLGQSYHFNLVSNENLWILNGKDFDTGAIKIHTDILLNQTIKNYSKTSMQELPRYRLKTGEASGTVKIKDFNIVRPSFLKPLQREIPIWGTKKTIKLKDYKFVLPSEANASFLSMETQEREVDPRTLKLYFLQPFERDTAIPRANLEGQMVQLISTPISLLSRFGWTVLGIPLGHLCYLALGPIGEWAALRYKIHYYKELRESKGDSHPLTQRVGHQVEEDLARWHNLKIMGTPYTEAFGYYFKVIPQSLWYSTKEFSRSAVSYLAHFTYHAALATAAQMPVEEYQHATNKCRRTLLQFWNGYR